MKVVMAVPALVLTLAAVPLRAQTSGVFDMGTLTGTLSQDAITQSEERRSGTGRYARRQSDAASAARARAGCARRGEFRARYGAGDERVRRFEALCARAGY